MGVEFYDESEIDPVLRAVCSNWMSKIEHAKQHKSKVFQKDADECQQFFDGPKNWSELMGGGSSIESGEGFPELSFKISVNKTFEFVTIFGPALYYENPVRTAKPRMPIVVPPMFFPDPQFYSAVIQQENTRVMTDGLRGVLLESMMNQSPIDFDLAKEARSAIDEALIKGRGVIWTELHQTPGAPFRSVRSSHDSTDSLLIDPDAPSFEKATWIARKCIQAVWQVERDFGLRPGSLKGSCESMARQSDVASSEELQYERKKGLTNDLIVYYKIYSKMGMGGRLSGSNPDHAKPLEMFGDYSYLVVAEGVPFLLNLPPDICNDPAQTRETVFGRTNWPTPFWAAGAWPCSVLDFHSVSNCPWPSPHLKAGMGELKFLNWVMSMLMSKMKTTSRDIIACGKALSEEIKNTILHGGDLELVEVEAGHEDLSDIFKILQFNPVNPDIWKMIEAAGNNFDKRVGLTELMYGSSGSTQIRSAQEAEVRNENMNVRPEDMAKQVEAWQSRVAALEAMCLRWHIHGADVSPIIGPIGAMAWDQYVCTQDLSAAAHQLEYRIEAGSTRRPNKNAQNQQISQGFQALSPILTQYGAATGDMQPMNNLLADYAKSLELDPNRYQLKAPIPPPAPPEPTGPPGSAEEAKSSPPQSSGQAA